MAAQRRRALALRPWSPTPDGSPLAVTVPCRTTPDLSAPSVHHEVVLGCGWDVQTPHDLEAERVAAAFGSYSSCVLLVDRVVPAVRELTQQHARRLVPAMRRGSRGTWRPAPSAAGPCCSPQATAALVAEHLRSVEHVAASTGVPGDTVALLLQAVLRAHGVAGDPAPPPQAAARAADCVRGRGGIGSLWQAGVHPEVVVAIHDDLVPGGSCPLPEALYLGAVSGRPDLAWVADTLAAVTAAGQGEDTDDELAEWLVWTPAATGAACRAACRGWLVLGVPRGWVPDLLESRYEPEDARALAAGTGLSPVGAVGMLRRWMLAGCHPSVQDLLDLCATGVPAWYTPSRGAVHRLVALAGDGGTSRTDAGLALARTGTVEAARRALAAASTREACA